MSKLLNALKALRANQAATFLYLASATAVLFVVAVVSALVVKNPSKNTSHVAAEATTTSATSGASETPTSAGETATTTGATQATAGRTGPTGRKGSGTVATPNRNTTVVTLASQAGATRTGVGQQTLKWGLHAPKTLQGLPWGLADDALKGARIFLNQINVNKVNGRTITEYFADDRYDTSSGAAAGDYLINQQKVFFAEGTLGVDQIAQVAKAAHDHPNPTVTPYMAAGGAESRFKDIGMYQFQGSYDTHLEALVHFLDKEVDLPQCPKRGAQWDPNCPATMSPYGGIVRTNGKVRIGVSALNSIYIDPAVDSLRDAVSKSKNLSISSNAIVHVDKPESGNQAGYSDQIAKLSANADIVIPAQDPLTTSNEVAECNKQALTCKILWTMSDFAHDGDVDLALMAGSWTGLRGLSAGCYYLVWNNPAYSGKCGQLTNAHNVWVNGTDPDPNDDGNTSDSEKQSESTWNSKGQSGIFGYQVTHFWLKALTDAGTDLTREKFLAALNAYSNYDDLISVPLSFAGSPNKAHGIDGFAIYQAGAPDPNKPKGVGWNQLSNGLIRGL